MKKYLITSVAVLALGTGIWVARPSDGSEPLTGNISAVPGSLVASETKFDFGTIRMKDGNVSREITITNTGDGPVKLGKLYTSCMCTTAALNIGGEKYGPYGMPGHGYIPGTGATLDKDQSMTELVTFDPNAHGPAGVGHIERVVTLEYGKDQTLKVDFSADVIP